MPRPPGAEGSEGGQRPRSPKCGDGQSGGTRGTRPPPAALTFPPPPAPGRLELARPRGARPAFAPRPRDAPARSAGAPGTQLCGAAPGPGGGAGPELPKWPRRWGHRGAGPGRGGALGWEPARPHPDPSARDPGRARPARPHPSVPLGRAPLPRCRHKATRVTHLVPRGRGSGGRRSRSTAGGAPSAAPRPGVRGRVPGALSRARSRARRSRPLSPARPPAGRTAGGGRVGGGERHKDAGAQARPAPPPPPAAQRPLPPAARPASGLRPPPWAAPLPAARRGLRGPSFLLSGSLAGTPALGAGGASARWEGSG